MSLFRRRAKAGDPAEALEASGAETSSDAPQEDEQPSAESESEFEPELSDRSEGPWDVAERPDGTGYVDLGGLRIPPQAGMELRLELDEATGAVSSATVALGGSAVQLQAFAAPRSEGIWAEIREEIMEGIRQQRGHADDVPGAFGREIIARIPVRTPDGRTGHTAARFVGVDGPRWFLRAVFHGEAVHQANSAQVLEEVVRGVVVVRGSEAMAPRELLPLRLPDAPPQPADEPERAELRPFERGPEITEVR